MTIINTKAVYQKLQGILKYLKNVSLKISKKYTDQKFVTFVVQCSCEHHFRQSMKRNEFDINYIQM